MKPFESTADIKFLQTKFAVGQASSLLLRQQNRLEAYRTICHATNFKPKGERPIQI